MNKKILALIPVSFMLLFNIGLLCYDNYTNKNVKIIDIQGDKNYLKDFEITSLYNNVLYDYKKLYVKDNNLSFKNISSDKFIKESRKNDSNYYFDKDSNLDLVNYIAKLDYSNNNSFSDNNYDGIVSVDGLYEDTNELNFKVALKDLKTNKISDFEVSINKPKFLLDYINNGYSTPVCGASLNNNKLYVVFESHYRDEQGEMLINVYEIDIKEKTVKQVFSEKKIMDYIYYSKGFSYKDNIYILSTIAENSENNKNKFVLYKYNTQKNNIETIDFSKEFLGNSYENYDVFKIKTDKNNLNIIFSNKDDYKKIMFLSLDLNTNKIKKIDIDISHIDIKLDDYNSSYVYNIRDFKLKNDKLLLNFYINNKYQEYLVFDINTNKLLYEGKINIDNYINNISIKWLNL